MVESRLTRMLLRLGAGLTLAFIYLPLMLIAVYAFNESVTQRWPIDDFSTKWFSGRVPRPGRPRRAAALGAGGGRRDGPRASSSGRCSRSRCARFAFFGRDTITLLVILPIALPGHRHRARASDDDHRRTRPSASRSG